MVTNGPPTRIVVGVDSSTTSLSAVLWAAEEARLRHLTLIITHIAPAGAGIEPSSAWWVDRDGLSAVAAAASAREPGIAVGTLLLTGDIGDELIRLTRSVALLVLGVDRSRPGAAHGMIGATEDRVVAHAACPAVVISHQPALAGVAHGQVLVGWTDSADQSAVLRSAVVEAEARGAALTVVTDTPDTQPGPNDSTPGGADSLLSAVRAVERVHPQLHLTVRGSSPDLTAELLRRSTDADLLVIGCDQAADRWSTHTGELATWMTRTAQCPVMLVGDMVGRGDSDRPRDLQKIEA